MIQNTRIDGQELGLMGYDMETSGMPATGRERGIWLQA